MNVKWILAGAATLLALVGFVGVAVADPAEGADPSLSSQLAEVRRATAHYHDVEAALADGFVPTERCVQEPDLGAIGLRYVHPERTSDGELNPTEPEILLYMPGPSGQLKLVGVEYFAPRSALPDHPTVFGQRLDGPTAGHEPGQPEHYDLHAWIWHDNPAGTFAQYNPVLRCGAPAPDRPL